MMNAQAMHQPPTEPTLAAAAITFRPRRCTDST